MTGLAIKNASSNVGSNTVFVTGRRSMAKALSAMGITTGKMSSLKGKSITPSGFRFLDYDIPLDRPTSLGTNICTFSSINSNLSITTPSTGYMTKYSDKGIRVRRNTSTPASVSVAEFKFRSTNYFVSSNTGHFAVILRGLVSSTTLEGKGIIIGNVSKYRPKYGICKPTDLQHDIGVESFFGPENCVYGSANNPRPLKDEVIYSVKIVANDIRKTITFRIRGEDGYDRTQVIDDAFYDDSDIPDGFSDFGIGCVTDNSGRTWTMEFGDIAYYYVR